MIGPCIWPKQLSHGQFDILSTEKILFEQGFMIYRQNFNDYHHSLFESIFTHAPWFDVSNIKKRIGQNFYNCFICNDDKAINCLQQHLSAKNIEKE